MEENIKKQFPIFSANKGLIYLDNAATTQKAQVVINAIAEYYSRDNANVHRGIYDLSERATEVYEESRQLVTDFIGGQGGYTIFTSGTTFGLNIAAQAFSEDITDGTILTTAVEHHSNFLPWREMARKSGLDFKIVPINESGRITVESLTSSLKKIKKGQIRVFALNHVSNVTGFIAPIAELAKIVREHSPDCVVVVDGAQAVGHTAIDLSSLGADLYAFSGHKMYAGMGIGALWGKKALLDRLNPSMLGGGMVSDVTLDSSKYAKGVQKWEAGTPSVAGAVGLAAAVEFLSDIGMAEVQKHEKDLAEYFIESFSELGGVKIIGGTDLEDRIGLFSMYSDIVHPHDVADFLNRDGVAVRAGHHCVHPFHKSLGLNGSFRVSFGVYNTRDDIDQFVSGMKKCLKYYK